MITPELKSYIQSELERGVSKEDLRKALISAGWPPADVEEGLPSGSPIFSAPSAASISAENDLSPLFSEEAPADASSGKLQAIKSKISALVAKLSRKKSAAAESPGPAAVSAAAPIEAGSGFKGKLAALAARPGFKKVLIAGCACLFLLIGSGIAAFFYLRSPARLVAKMMSNLSDVKSMEYSARLKAAGPGNALSGLSAGGFGLAAPGQGGAPAIGEIMVDLSGAGDFINLNDPKFKFALNVFAGNLNGGKPIGFDTVALKSGFFFKVNNVGEIAGFDLSSLSDQWISFVQPAGAPAAQDLSSDEIQSLKKAMRKAKIIRIEAELAPEDVQGVPARHFKFAFDKDGLKNLMADLGKEPYGKKLNGKKLQDFEKSIEAKPMPTGEIWIGQKDSMPYKLVMDLTEKTPASLTLAFSRFNQPVQVDAPAQSRPFQDVLMMVMTGGLKAKPGAVAKKGGKPAAAVAAAPNKKDPAVQQAKTVPSPVVAALDNDGSEYIKGTGSPSVDTDGDGLDDEMESMIGSNPRKQDTDGDGVKDGTEVKRGEDPTSRN